MGKGRTHHSRSKAFACCSSSSARQGKGSEETSSVQERSLKLDRVSSASKEACSDKAYTSP